MQIPVRFIWNEPNQKWLGYFDEGSNPKYVGKFFYDFWDCGTVIFALGNPDKSKVNRYMLTIEKVE